MDLTGADLTGARLRGADLTGADLTGARLRGADLTGARLRGADLTGADLTGADLTRADLTRAKLPGVNLERTYLRGANLTDAELIGALNLEPRARRSDSRPIRVRQLLVLSVDLGPGESPESLSAIFAGVAALARLAVTVATPEPGVARGRSFRPEVSTVRLQYGSPFMMWLQEAWTAVQPWVAGGSAAGAALGIVNDARKGPEKSGLLDLVLTFARPEERRPYLASRVRRWEQAHPSAGEEGGAVEGGHPSEIEPVLTVAPMDRQGLAAAMAATVDGEMPLNEMDAAKLQPLLYRGFSVQVVEPEASSSMTV